MITVTYDYTGQNLYTGNRTRTFETEAEFHNWAAVQRPFIFHVQGYREPTTTQTQENNGTVESI